MNALAEVLLLGVDGGGSRCRARLCTIADATLSEGGGGPANIRLGVEQSFASVLQATIQCMSGAGLSSRDFERVVACLALAGASEPSHLEAARQHAHPYRMAVFVTDAQAAYVGAHGGHDGGIIVIGTGSIGGAELNGRQYRVGGLAGSIEPWLADATRRHLVSPRGDAVAGAVQLARDAAESLHRGLTAPRRSR